METRMSIAQVREIVEERLSAELFSHSFGVQETALALARHYGVDEEKAVLAGLLHDFGKSLSLDEQQRLASKEKLADEVSRHEPVLLHGPVGAWLVQQEFRDFVDEEVLEAIREHTIGSPDLCPLAQIIYLADYIEPGRTCPGVEEVREMACKDLNRALLGAVDMTIKYVLKREKLLHPQSVLFRNALLLSFREET